MPDLQPAAEQLAALVAAVRDDQLDAPTPCPEYSLGDLLDHVGGVAVAFAAAATKEQGINAQPPPPGDAANLADDWRAQIPRDLRALAGSWRDASAWDGDTWIAGMQMPAAVVGQVGLNELVAHGWDVARSTGEAFDPDAETIAACFELMEPMSQPGSETMREPAFGPVVEVADDAPPLDRLVALTGRDPRWSPA